MLFVYLLQIKTHLQSQSNEKVAVGFQHRHSGFTAALRFLYLSYGVFGLWQGVTASVLRVGIGSAGQLATFSKSREFIENHEVD